MLILFLILFILSAQLIHSVATDQKIGYNPYPFGTTIICLLVHLVLLILSIYYLGWLWGIVLFLCHLFGIVHATVSWVLGIPQLVANSMDRIMSIMKARLRLLGPILALDIIFAVVSFFVSDFKSLLIYVKSNTVCLIVAAVIVAVLFIARLIVSHCMPDDE